MMLDLTKMLPPLVVVLPLCCSSVSGHSEAPRKIYGVSAKSDALADGAEDAKAVEQQEIKVAAVEPLGGVAPIKDPKKVIKSHAPFEAGECELCHKNNNPKNPGPVNGDINALCLQCHDAIGDKMKKMPTLHPAVEDSCTNCHNPHNSTEPQLLRGKITTLCFECHEDTKKLAQHAKGQHDAVLVGKACLNCHDPHATQVEHLLLAAPFDLCISCHGDDKDFKLIAVQPFAQVNFAHIICAHIHYALGQITDDERQTIVHPQPLKTLDPNKTQVARELKMVSLLIKVKKYDKAMAMVDKVQAEHPEDARVWVAKAEILAAQGKCPEAKTALKQAQSKDPKANWNEASQAACAK